MSQQAVEVCPALVDYRRQADDFRTGSYYYQQFQPAIILELDKNNTFYLIPLIGRHCREMGN
jgi:hypothetical protein